MSDPTPPSPPGKGTTAAAGRLRATCCAAAAGAGVTGTVACALAMTLTALGVGAAGTASAMAGMGGGAGLQPSRVGGVLGALLRTGPELLLASVVLVSLAFLIRHRAAALPAALAGGVLFWGMYAQSSALVMYGSMAAGYASWGALYWWARRRVAASPTQLLAD